MEAEPFSMVPRTVHTYMTKATRNGGLGCKTTRPNLDTVFCPARRERLTAFPSTASALPIKPKTSESATSRLTGGVRPPGVHLHAPVGAAAALEALLPRRRSISPSKSPNSYSFVTSEPGTTRSANSKSTATTLSLLGA